MALSSEDVSKDALRLENPDNLMRIEKAIVITGTLHIWMCIFLGILDLLDSTRCAQLRIFARIWGKADTYN